MDFKNKKIYIFFVKSFLLKNIFYIHPRVVKLQKKIEEKI